jgi:UDP-N-acetyl-D-galactosamine dehydrogenase
MMGMFIANKVVKLMISNGHKINNSSALILGATFKENCPDIRNSKVIDIYTELKQFGINVDIFDPHANKDEVAHEYGISLINELPINQYDAIILAVAHNEFLDLNFSKLKRSERAVIFDTKSVINRSIVNSRL